MKLRRSAGMVAAVLVLAACTGDGSTALPTGPTAGTAETTRVPSAIGHISGTLTMVGGPAFTPPMQVSGTIRAFLDPDAATSPVSVVATDDSGRFEIALPRGTYHLVGRSPKFGGERLPCHAQSSISVDEGNVVYADVFCSMH